MTETVGDYLTAAWLKSTGREVRIEVADPDLLDAYCGFLICLNQDDEVAVWAAGIIRSRLGDMDA